MPRTQPAAKRAFFSAPQSVRSLVAALLEPGLTVVAFLVVCAALGQPIGPPELTLCLFVFALTFPGRDRFRDTPTDAALDIFWSWLWLFALLSLLRYMTRERPYFDDTVLLSWALATPPLQCLATWIGQSLIRRHALHPASRRSVVVVGSGELGVRAAAALTHSADDAVDVAGFFDDRNDDRAHPNAAARRLGSFADLASYIKGHGTREVYITLPLGSQPRIVALLEQLQDTTASLFFVPDVSGVTVIQGRLQDVNGVPVVGICETPFTGTNRLVKRISDLVLASAILVTVSPLLLFIALGVKLSSPGPVIFRQQRNGLDGHEITVYKFRSMTTQDNGTVVHQATKSDPRTTRFGAFLRRNSLDELPQFFNVLQGRMSIVGPRPHAVAHNEEYREVISAYMVRHKVKPGITGWAQVNGLRGETDTVEKMNARVELDLEYLRNWSLGLDLQIIARTVRVAFVERNAY